MYMSQYFKIYESDSEANEIMEADELILEDEEEEQQSYIPVIDEVLEFSDSEETIVEHVDEVNPPIPYCIPDVPGPLEDAIVLAIVESRSLIKLLYCLHSHFNMYGTYSKEHKKKIETRIKTRVEKYDGEYSSGLAVVKNFFK